MFFLGKREEKGGSAGLSREWWKKDARCEGCHGKDDEEDDEDEDEDEDDNVDGSFA